MRNKLYVVYSLAVVALVMCFLPGAKADTWWPLSPQGLPLMHTCNCDEYPGGGQYGTTVAKSYYSDDKGYSYWADFCDPLYNVRYAGRFDFVANLKKHLEKWQPWELYPQPVFTNEPVDDTIFMIIPLDDEKPDHHWYQEIPKIQFPSHDQIIVPDKSSPTPEDYLIQLTNVLT